MAATQSFFSETYDTRFPTWCYEACPCDTQSITFSAHLKIQINNGKWKTKLLQIKNEFILTNTKQNDLKWICYLNASLKIIKNPREQTSTLELSQGQNLVAIRGDIENLIKIIKRYTVQEEFRMKFQLVKKFGQGAFAEVYSAKKKQTDDYFAVKMFEKSFINSHLDKQSLLKEIKVLRTIYHESTVSLLELYETQCYIYVVMELLKGGNLSSYLDKYAPLSEKQTAQIIYKLLVSLNHINSFGIFHRDLKPDNIVFREKGNFDSLCVTDYGLADFYNQEAKYLFHRCGSVGFVAPEILHDCAYDLKVDLYSVGIIMYCALSGTIPFEGNTHQKVQQNYKGEVKTSNLNLSPKGLQFINSILQPYPSKRIDLQDALIHPWFLEQNLSNLKVFKLKNKKASITNQNVMLTPPIGKSSPFSTPRSPQSPITNPSQQSSFLTKIAGKKLSNFQLEDDSTPRESQRCNTQCNFLKKIAIRKSIFNHLEPLKRQKQTE
ncbi:unnamed protein product (macronuclear) [Paramecium tetraurelia]|uniref:non-specific serine/threonine protein kinase n=1 Tax=Paramecium tetraurelia TaxID=5888 RepID=A0BTD1_PARTE|nr:uncharacterized protein GSPATT00032030001 [Paramecium tetraurelia]CAK61798.1 unnamed protein product [Paramecium tetraurelia]|eukprot:XP_001429196.1 hypothetical protein (macronuclear) [Paramecium tetraurelia strain d4-2]